MTTSYPEHAKLKAIRDDSQRLGTFLAWLKEQGWMKVKFNDRDDPILVHEPINVVLAQYFEIDLQKLELEKLAMLEELRKDDR